MEMRLEKITMAILVLIASGSSSYAQDARCAAPPYGVSVGGYNSFITHFGPMLDDPSRMLSGICNVKFSHADRKALYNLGFTDLEINTKDTSDLAVQLVVATKNLVGGR